ncbi:MAG TPA: glycosyltransferase family 2 protein [Acidimicrobiales bacterium]
MSVVLPCLDEAASVGLCVLEARDALDRIGGGDVIVVDNGSTDGSADVARAAGAIVIHEPRPGYGRAIRTGVDAAPPSVVVVADADMTYDLSRLGELVSPVLAGEADLVIGARRGGTDRRAMPLTHRLVGTPVLSYLIRNATGGQVLVDDSQSGFRAMPRDTFVGLDLNATGMEFASEMLIRAARQDLRITELPLGYRKRIGTSKLSARADAWRHVREIASLAPAMFLIGPGVMLAGLGLTVAIWSVVAGDAVTVGSWRWEPVFFATIALVIGAQAALVGVLLEARSPGPTVRSRRWRSFVYSPNFGRWCGRSGAVLAVTGALVDIALVPLRAHTGIGDERALALAGLAQSMLIVGCTAAGFGALWHRVAEIGIAPEGRRANASG